jgi:hypothetical protein
VHLSHGGDPSDLILAALNEVLAHVQLKVGGVGRGCVGRAQSGAAASLWSGSRWGGVEWVAVRWRKRGPRLPCRRRPCLNPYQPRPSRPPGHSQIKDVAGAWSVSDERSAQRFVDGMVVRSKGPATAGRMLAVQQVFGLAGGDAAAASAASMAAALAAGILPAGGGGGDDAALRRLRAQGRA